jgi:phage/plasmid-like protein (TIGR03299 family)
MAHNIEEINGVAQMAYAGDVPWHGLGTKVPSDLTPEQMLDAAGLNWEVQKVPAFAEITPGWKFPVGKSALIRMSDNKVLDVVSDEWNPVQNQEAFEFFNDFVAAGEMEMHTAGSLQDGKIVWGLAKVKESFELFKGDQIDSYLLFSNFHKFGFATDVRFTPIRVVCNNTLTLSLNQNVSNMAKISHRRKFDGDNVKIMLGVASEKLAQYKEMASYLGSKRYTNENVVDYFKRVFPVLGPKKAKDISKSAEEATLVLHGQPGAQYAEGSWWQAFNAVTYMTDHVIGRNADNRLTSAWYGANKNLKTRALELAVEMADAA